VIVTVPPVFPVVAELVDELDELPHAASAITEPTATTAIEAALKYLLIDPPPQRSWVLQTPKIYSQFAYRGAGPSSS
jgi:hypothetical protein